MKSKPENGIEKSGTPAARVERKLGECDLFDRGDSRIGFFERPLYRV